MYWIAPIIGGIIATVLYKFLFSPFRGGVPMDTAVNELCKYKYIFLKFVTDNEIRTIHKPRKAHGFSRCVESIEEIL